jgi:ferric-dicitrate binding protein FerR (iron transport regulator)
MKEENEERIAALLRLAGPRPRPADDVTARVHAAVREEWMRSTQQRSRVRWLALAAALIVAVVLVVPRFRSKPAVPAAVIVASVQAVHGSTTLTLHDKIAEQTWIETPAGGTLALDWNGATLRLDEDTRLRLDSAQIATLERGAIYFDDGNAAVPAAGQAASRRPGAETAPVQPARTPAFRTIRTALGDIRDIGTRFEVRLREEILRVRVREGRVDLRRGNDHVVADAATELIANRNGIERNAIAVSGDDWKWIEEAAPPLRLEGLTLSEAIERVAREKGLRAELHGVEGNARLHGSVDFTPDEALDAATAATSATYRIERGALIVRRR